MHRIEIKRSLWGRSTRYHGGGFLHHPEQDKMCCLGFICLQAGFPKEEITGWGMLSSVVRHGSITVADLPELVQPLVTIVDDNARSTDLAETLAKLNDRDDIDDATREEMLIARAAKGGYEFVFVD